MDKYEQLAIAQAMYKALAALVSTKDPDSLRSQVDRELLADYQERGNDRIRLRVRGKDVGTLSVVSHEPKEETSVHITDKDALVEWAQADLADYMNDTRTWGDFIMWQIEQGCAPSAIPGVEITTTTTKKPATTTLRKCDPQAVGEALGEMLPSAVLGLIGAGESLE